MSEEQVETGPDDTMSSEDKFFGVKTTFVKGEQPSEMDLEVVDDRPPEDQRPASKTKAASDDDDELQGYSEKVKKRINKLRYDQHEERRRREDAERMREEAIRVAQQLTSENQNLQQILHEGEGVLLNQSKGRAQLALQQAETMLRQAVEEGNTERQVEAQKLLNIAQADLTGVSRQMGDYQKRQPVRPQQGQPQPQPQPQAQPRQAQEAQEVRKPSSKAMAWAENNSWFQSEDHTEMTAYAYGVHEKMIRQEGIDPESDEYYEELDKRVQSRFPEYFGEVVSGSTDEPVSSTSRSPSVVVAPSERNNGAKPRKVRLSRTQVALAKRLGLTVEQYANQLLKEN
tara:strand:+ start:3629 stop:4657 length:1029 start_codon:yes stop_codon:yes gene_type:complete